MTNTTCLRLFFSIGPKYTRYHLFVVAGKFGTCSSVKSKLPRRNCFPSCCGFQKPEGLFATADQLSEEVVVMLCTNKQLKLTVNRKQWFQHLEVNLRALGVGRCFFRQRIAFLLGRGNAKEKQKLCRN